LSVAEKAGNKNIIELLKSHGAKAEAVEFGIGVRL